MHFRHRQTRATGLLRPSEADRSVTMREPRSETESALFDPRSALAAPGATVSRVRIPPTRSILAIFVALLAAVWATGGASSAQEPELRAPAITEFGPTSKAPSGGQPEGRASGNNRWKYRGTLGVLGNNEQVVPPITDPPAEDPERAPLTGKKSGALDRRALVIKIDNVRAAHPQTGINSADIVYEELVEGGATRLAAVFHSKLPTTIGPVRSARSTDIGIAVPFDWPIFAFSGANSIFERLVANARLADRGAEVAGELYYRSAAKAAPHNLFTTSSRLLNSATQRDGPPPQFAYRSSGDSIAPDVPTATTIQLKFQEGRGVPVRYEWNKSIGGWLRWQNGRRHVDSAGVQVAPQNVVVQVVPYADAGLTDKFGEDLFEAQMVGSGKAMVFTNGHVHEATWTRPTLRSVTTYTDANGEHILLTRGRTWVALVPPGGVTFNAHKCNGTIATIVGDSGDNTLRGTGERDVIVGLAGADIIDGRGGRDLICGGSGADQIFGGSGNDTVLGGSGADDLRGGPGNDRVNGGGGNDQIHGGPGEDLLRGKGGTDQIYGQETVDEIFGGDNDVILRGP